MYNPYILAKNICKTLFEKGYTAYFAGGWVRDLLLGKSTDEIDIATNASPDVIQGLFPKTIPVGIAFGVVIVAMEETHFEVATFRKDHLYIDGRHPEGVDFSTPEQDALRRDFTINGMFYDPLTEAIYDYVGGKEDLQKGIIRAIGNPQERFAEDRLRMIRAVRFASRLGFQIEEKTIEAIRTYAPAIFPSVSMERIWQEFVKMAAYPHFDQSILMLHDLGLLSVIFPTLQGDSAAEIEKRVASFPCFPVDTPVMAYLLELFPLSTIEERLQLCVYLKTSVQERKLVEFFNSSHQLFKQEEVEPYEWVHFYAHPLSTLFWQILAAKMPPPQRVDFLEEQSRRQETWHLHIERIQKKEPLVSAALLIEKGVKPGKEMGSLLKEAERIAINGDYSDPATVLSLLNLSESHSLDKIKNEQDRQDI